MSFEEFVQGCSPRLFRTALLLAGQDRAAAEDLLQLALERAYRHWGRVCRSGDPERYVRRILANAANDRWRRAVRRPERPLDSRHAGLVVADQADTVADRDFLIRALAGLPPRQRTVLAITPDGKTVYAAAQNKVVPISTATNRPGQPIRLRYGLPGGIVTTP